MKGEFERHTVADQSERGHRPNSSPGDFWLARLESVLGTSECRVLELSPGNATVQLDHPLPEKQAVTLHMDQLGELSGVVAWQRDGCIGIRIIEHRPPGSAVRTSPGMRSASKSAVPPAAASTAPLARGAQIPAETRPAGSPAPEGIAVERWGDPSLLDAFRNEKHDVVLQPGEILFKEGDVGTAMYVVRDGVLRIRSGSVVYEDVVRGGVVGEMGLIEKHMPRSATVYALTACELVEVDEQRFFSLIEQTPQLAVTVMRVLSRRLRHMDGRYRLARWTDPHR